MDERVSYTAQHPARETASAMTTEYDQIYARRLGTRQELLNRQAITHFYASINVRTLLRGSQ
jgi:hypothetical protein